MPASPTAARATETALVVVNPASAGGRTLRRWPDILAALRGAGIPLRAHITISPGEATECTRAALRSGTRRIIAVGGDGTLNEVINGCFEVDGTPISTETEVALIPSGTGGDFGRRSLELPKTPAENARLIAAGHIRTIDVGRVEFEGGGVRYFVNIADCGIGGEVVARVNRSRFKGGGVRGTGVFLGTSLSALMSYGGRDATIDIDGEIIRRRVQQVIVANGRAFGGGMLIAPDARIDDGLFDIVIVAEMGRVEALRALPSLYKGTHLSHRAIEHRRGKTVTVTPERGAELLFDVEGEQVGQAPAMITCMPGALRMIAPR